MHFYIPECWSSLYIKAPYECKPFIISATSLCFVCLFKANDIVSGVHWCSRYSNVIIHIQVYINQHNKYECINYLTWFLCLKPCQFLKGMPFDQHNCNFYTFSINILIIFNYLFYLLGGFFFIQIWLGGWYIFLWCDKLNIFNIALHGL